MVKSCDICNNDGSINESLCNCIYGKILKIIEDNPGVRISGLTEVLGIDMDIVWNIVETMRRKGSIRSE